MSPSSYQFILSLILVTLLNYRNVSCISKSDFPQDFIFGAGSSAYQIEGAANLDGKGPNNWDYYTHKYPATTTWDGSNGDVSADFYHHYKNDIKLMKKIGLTHFRFSISWSRILPKGTKAGGVNQLGIDFYNNVIDELLANDIQPFVTLFHWDIPHALEEAYGSFLSNNIVSDFVDFANICFKEFGDRVKKWVTITKPNTYAQLAYASGDEVPNRCSHLKSSNTSLDGPRCFGGNSATEPYIVAHNLLLSHASVVALYRQKFQASQNGTIGITVSCNWVEPYDFKPKTVNATTRYFDHSCGWFFNPLNFGDYPETMHSLVGNRLPKFTADQSILLKNSFDFIGLDYYTAFYIQEDNATTPHYDLDDHAKKTFSDKDGMHLGKKDSIDFYDYPTGLENVTLYLRENYNNPIIIVTKKWIRFSR
ncbi:beta-glucosidase 17-like [Silene latifolia]|uniref:beta-glucosidase 17-like n=1 Tax=Silene latifolia TaxID=37657 RepID=UPI003D782EE4